LGRAPLADEALEAIHEVAAGYCNLELNLQTGARGDRHEHVCELLTELTGAEAALVVNNNAAATYLALNSLAADRGVIVSRGQLVEIGGSYRMPDIMRAARCRMIEVGTTNRTHVADYERAIDAETAVLLHVHTSNYRVQGFVTSPGPADLAALAKRCAAAQGLLVVDDLGSGLLDRFAFCGSSGDAPAWDEPTVRESVDASCDVTLFSGDKLLGGPQAGVIVGRGEPLARMRADPLMRTFRPDKLTLAALEATLRLYRDPTALLRRLPIFRMLAGSLGAIEALARRLAERLTRHVADARVEVATDESYAGGGSLPTVPFKTWVVRVSHSSASAAAIAAALRQAELPVICRVSGGEIVFDCRTLSDDDATVIATTFGEALQDAQSDSQSNL
ncbi:MAG: L-seryl-tRNA(Sec) selenium transferase, partial [Planctomycetes bacterium]|nr:L-seryl-tRNA(Sec) selenium transferase [Planctomycetota bacterium]